MKYYHLWILHLFEIGPPMVIFTFIFYHILVIINLLRFLNFTILKLIIVLIWIVSGTNCLLSTIFYWICIHLIVLIHNIDLFQRERTITLFILELSLFINYTNLSFSGKKFFGIDELIFIIKIFTQLDFWHIKQF